jgi:anti-sigma-K factor RskA
MWIMRYEKVINVSNSIKPTNPTNRERQNLLLLSLQRLLNVSLKAIVSERLVLGALVELKVSKMLKELRKAMWRRVVVVVVVVVVIVVVRMVVVTVKKGAEAYPKELLVAESRLHLHKSHSNHSDFFGQDDKRPKNKQKKKSQLRHLF